MTDRNLIAAGDGTGNDTLTKADDFADTTVDNFEIVNDGSAALTYTINAITIKVPAGSVSNEFFEKGFTSVAITATSTYVWKVRK